MAAMSFNAVLDEALSELRKTIVGAHERDCEGLEVGAISNASSRSVAISISPRRTVGSIDEKASSPPSRTNRSISERWSWDFTDVAQSNDEARIVGLWRDVYLALCKYGVKRFNLRKEFRDCLLEEAQDRTAKVKTMSSVTKMSLLASDKREKRRSVRPINTNSLQPVAKGVVFHPSSIYRLVWIILGLALVLCDFIVVPISNAFEAADDNFSRVACWVGRIFWTVDIIMTFLTGAHQNGVLIMEAIDVARTYVQTWFVFDVTIVLVDWAIWLIGKYVMRNTTSRFMLAFSLLRLLRLLQFWRHSDPLMTMLSKVVPVAWLCYGNVTMIMCCVAWNHIATCAWSWIKEVDRAQSSQGGSDSVRTFTKEYLSSSQWALAQLHGTSFAAPESISANAFNIVCQCAGFFLLSFTIARTTQTMIQYRDMDASEMRRAWQHYLSRHPLSSGLVVRAHKFLKVHRKQLEIAADTRQDSEFLSALPTVLREDILEEIYKPLLVKITMFRSLWMLHPSVLRQICQEVMVGLQCIEEEAVFSSGDPCHRVLFLQIGSLKYLRDTKQSLSRLYNLIMPTSACMTTRPSDEAGTRSHASVTTHRVSGATNASNDSEVSKLDSERTEIFSSKKMTNKASLLSKSKGGSYDASLETILSTGAHVSEAALWTEWTHSGDLIAQKPSKMMALETAGFLQILQRRKNIEAFRITAVFAKSFVSQLCSAKYVSDLFQFDSHLEETDPEEAFADYTFHITQPEASHYKDSHLIFLSHYKAEAGTEATLMAEQLERMVSNQQVRRMTKAIFLDSEDLTDLTLLVSHVISSCNLVLLLTPGVLTRPWCLVELVMAFRKNVMIVPVEIQRPGIKFKYPDESFYSSLRNGSLLSPDCRQLLIGEQIGLDELEQVIRHVFLQIALPFSPHKSHNIRQAELEDILKRCPFRKVAHFSYSVSFDSERPSICPDEEDLELSNADSVALTDCAQINEAKE